MATLKDLQREVDRLNEKYCKNTANELVINRSYGGYAVQLTGKTYKKGNTYYNRGMSGAARIGNQYSDTATKTLEGLYNAESRGWLKNDVKIYENEVKRRKRDAKAKGYSTIRKSGW